MQVARDQENVTTNESENGGSRRMSEEYVGGEVDEQEELVISAEEIERLMMFDMMRQNFKLDDKIGASPSAPIKEQDGNNNNIVRSKDP